MLSSFEVKQFRGFSRLRIDRLANVNLIIGRNNVGKTNLLEALRLYASAGDASVIRNLLAEREEFAMDNASGPRDDSTNYEINSLFYHGDSGDPSKQNEFRLGLANDQAKALIIRARQIKEVKDTGKLEVVKDHSDLADPNIMPALEVVRGNAEPYFFPFSWFGPARVYSGPPRVFGIFPMPSPYMPPRGLSDREAARWWDLVTLRQAEERVKESLRIISPVAGVSFVERPSQQGERIAMVRLDRSQDPVPLKSLGDGLTRMLHLALALEYARNLAPDKGKHSHNDSLFPLSQAILLADEIENGLHYTVHADLWRYIIRTSRIHNVQVFATSHSWDSILGLREAVRDIPDASVMVIRLEKKPQYTKAVLFDGSELDIVAREGIEVR